MNIDELKKLVKGKAIFKGAYENTPEDVAEVREILKSSVEHDEFPYYSGFEHIGTYLRNVHLTII